MLYSLQLKKCSEVIHFWKLYYIMFFSWKHMNTLFICNFSFSFILGIFYCILSWRILVHFIIVLHQLVFLKNYCLLIICLSLALDLNHYASFSIWNFILALLVMIFLSCFDILETFYFLLLLILHFYFFSLTHQLVLRVLILLNVVA